MLQRNNVDIASVPPIIVNISCIAGVLSILPHHGCFCPEQALQYRLREDIQQCGGDLSKFDQLKDMRGLEYELDRIANRAARDKQVVVYVNMWKLHRSAEPVM